MEAFARVAEETCFPPYAGAFEEQEWSIPRLRDLPLHYKLESLLLQCYDSICDNAFKANFPKPSQSFFTPVEESDDSP